MSDMKFNITEKDVDNYYENNYDNSESQSKNENKNQPDEAKLSECESKLTESNGKTSWAKAETVGSGRGNTVIDIKETVLKNAINQTTWLGSPNLHFKNNSKQGIRKPQPKSLFGRNTKIWVQFTQEQGFDYDNDRDDNRDTDRNRFILVVMLIVFVMLLITSGWIVAVLKVPRLYQFFASVTPVTMAIAGGAMMILSCGLTCVPMLQKSPCIFFMLVLALILMSFMAAVLSCRYSNVIVLYAFVSTAAIVLVCAILACTSFDFTSLLLYFVVFATAFSVIAALIFVGMLLTGTYMKPLHIAILCISVILNSVGLVMELQMIIGGRAVELDENEHGMAAFLLYTSILQIFMNVVQLLGLLDLD